jgi:hypothetical protein
MGQSQLAFQSVVEAKGKREKITQNVSLLQKLEL